MIVLGAVRDTKDIAGVGLPVFARLVCPHAGEPKGFGEVNVALRVDGIECRPGDWVVADDDGAIVIPKARALEAANRAQYCLEVENRLRAEILAGSTLAQVADLYKWEKKIGGAPMAPPPASSASSGSPSGGASSPRPERDARPPVS